MVNKKKEEEVKYHFVLKLECKKCGLEMKNMVPCPEDHCTAFVRVYKLEEVKKDGSET